MIRAALAVLATLALAGCADGDGGVALERVGEFEQPVYVAQPPERSDDLYVVERCGRVVRVPEAGGAAETFLDLGGEVTCDGTEQGLLSIAFHPNFDANGRFYAYFTDLEGATRIVEYESVMEDPRAAIEASARQLLRIEDFAVNHNGGQLQFGRDGLLYLGTGDGGGAGDPERTAQDPASQLGKILRIDPRGGAPEIVALGLRNPWRFSFDRAENDLWIGDVGQSSLEELDAAAASELAARRPQLNFGWSAFEGTERYNEDVEAPGAIPPVLEYPLDGSTCAVTGGYVVRDPGLPTLFGRYLYGDYCTGELRSFTAETALSGGAATDDRELGLRVPALSSFGEDARGRIYAVSLEGPVYRLVAE